MTPDNLDFGSQPVGTPSEPKNATVTNTGTTVLAVRDVTVSGIDFTENNTCERNLAPGATCTIQVIFRPAIIGSRFGTVMVTSSDPASPHMLVLSGVGQ